jgi:hypothetical protein
MRYSARQLRCALAAPGFGSRFGDEPHHLLAKWHRRPAVKRHPGLQSNVGCRPSNPRHHRHHEWRQNGCAVAGRQPCRTAGLFSVSSSRAIAHHNLHEPSIRPNNCNSFSVPASAATRHCKADGKYEVSLLYDGRGTERTNSNPAKRLKAARKSRRDSLHRQGHIPEARVGRDLLAYPGWDFDLLVWPLEFDFRQHQPSEVLCEGAGAL